MRTADSDVISVAQSLRKVTTPAQCTATSSSREEPASLDPVCLSETAVAPVSDTGVSFSLGSVGLSDQVDSGVSSHACAADTIDPCDLPAISSTVPVDVPDCGLPENPVVASSPNTSEPKPITCTPAPDGTETSNHPPSQTSTSAVYNTISNMEGHVCVKPVQLQRCTSWSAAAPEALSPASQRKAVPVEERRRTTDSVPPVACVECPDDRCDPHRSNVLLSEELAHIFGKKTVAGCAHPDSGPGDCEHCDAAAGASESPVPLTSYSPSLPSSGSLNSSATADGLAFMLSDACSARRGSMSPAFCQQQITNIARLVKQQASGGGHSNCQVEVFSVSYTLLSFS